MTQEILREVIRPAKDKQPCWKCKGTADRYGIYKADQKDDTQYYQLVPLCKTCFNQELTQKRCLPCARLYRSFGLARHRRE